MTMPLDYTCPICEKLVTVVDAHVLDYNPLDFKGRGKFYMHHECYHDACEDAEMTASDDPYFDSLYEEYVDYCEERF